MSTVQPAYVGPGYAYDIFVSYAHLDNEAVVPEDGWVTAFLRRLPSKVQTRRTARPMWNDSRLAGHVEITPEILAAVRGSAFLVIVMSPSYLNSEWCQRERTAFLDVVAERAQSRLFMVHLLETDREARPKVLRERTGYQFWKRDSLSGAVSILDSTQDREEYHRMLDRMTYELAEELKRLAEFESKSAPATPTIARGRLAEEAAKRGPDGATATGRTQGKQTTVLLAEPTDDLQEQYDEIKQYLLRADLRIVPDDQYPIDAVPFKEAVERDLQASAIFVQILSSVVGRKLTGTVRAALACMGVRKGRGQTHSPVARAGCGDARPRPWAARTPRASDRPHGNPRGLQAADLGAGKCYVEAAGGDRGGSPRVPAARCRPWRRRLGQSCIEPRRRVRHRSRRTVAAGETRGHERIRHCRHAQL